MTRWTAEKKRKKCLIVYIDSSLITGGRRVGGQEENFVKLFLGLEKPLMHSDAYGIKRNILYHRFK